MKKVTLLIILLMLVFNLVACNADRREEMEASKTKITFIAEIVSLEEKFLVSVLESEYTSGEHILITNEKTQYLDSNGNKIEKNSLNKGDKIKVNYSGQVMLSYPPQVVAYVITKQL